MYDKTKMRIILAGTGKLGEVCLLALQKQYNVDIVFADNENLIQLKRESDRVIRSINESDCEYVFLAGWYPIIKKEDLKLKKYINFHGSLLPKYRGIHSIFWMIMNGEKQLGYTVHEVNERVDDGDILYQFKFDYCNQTVGQVHELFYKDIESKLGGILNSYINGNLRLEKQDFSQATWVPRRNFDDCLVDFDMPNLYLRRFFLALTAPYPLPRIIYKKEIYEIIDSEIIDRDYYCQTARIVNVDENGVWCKVKDGFLVVKKIRKVGEDVAVDANSLMRVGYRFLGGGYNCIDDFNEDFLKLSYKWLSDNEIRKLIMAPKISKQFQKKWYEHLKYDKTYKIFGVSHKFINVGAVGLKHIDIELGIAEYFGYIGEKKFWRKGIGRFMLNSMCEYAILNGINKLYLNVAINNIRAIKVYESNGFVKTRKDSKKICMEKRLNIMEL
ncbi:MAG: GNAT family N-acetyltransferase [Treponema sp.]|nr:GNAT family N-acetyltransferase [Treponema sp.]